MFGTGLLALLFAFGALAFIGGSGNDAADTDDDPRPNDNPDTPNNPDNDPGMTGQGGPGNDLINSRDDVSVYNGFGGNDTLVGFLEFGVRLNGGTGNDLLLVLDNDHGYGGDGDDLILGENVSNSGSEQVMRGGAGNDVLVSSGGSIMVGGNGTDSFVISPGGLDENDNMQSVYGDPLGPPLIRDFNPDEDRLVIDLESSFQDSFDQIFRTELGAPDGARDPIDFDGRVSLTAERSDDGSAVVILANGVPMAHLEGFADLAPEDLLNQIDVAVIGASEGETTLAPGLIYQDAGNDNVRLLLTDEFEGGGNFGGGDRFSVLDMSQLSADMRVTVAETGIITVEPADGSWPAVTFEEIDQVVLGDGDDVFDGSNGPGWVTAVAGNGEDTLIGGDSADIGDRLAGAGFALFEDGPEARGRVGATSIFGGEGRDNLLAGLGDTVTGGAGEDQFVVYGFGTEGAGPTIITDFNPEEDFLEYNWVDTADDTDGPHEIVVEDGEDGLVITDNGRIVVRVPGVTMADNPIIAAGDRSVVW